MQKIDCKVPEQGTMGLKNPIDFGEIRKSNTKALYYENQTCLRYNGQHNPNLYKQYNHISKFNDESVPSIYCREEKRRSYLRKENTADLLVPVTSKLANSGKFLNRPMCRKEKRRNEKRRILNPLFSSQSSPLPKIKLDNFNQKEYRLAKDRASIKRFLAKMGKANVVTNPFLPTNQHKNQSKKTYCNSTCLRSENGTNFQP
jgi:hypothetical protein